MFLTVFSVKGELFALYQVIPVIYGINLFCYRQLETPIFLRHEMSQPLATVCPLHYRFPSTHLIGQTLNISHSMNNNSMNCYIFVAQENGIVGGWSSLPIPSFLFAKRLSLYIS